MPTTILHAHTSCRPSPLQKEANNAWEVARETASNWVKKEKELLGALQYQSHAGLCLVVCSWCDTAGRFCGWKAHCNTCLSRTDNWSCRPVVLCRQGSGCRSCTPAGHW